MGGSASASFLQDQYHTSVGSFSVDPQADFLYSHPGKKQFLIKSGKRHEHERYVDMWKLFVWGIIYLISGAVWASVTTAADYPVHADWMKSLDDTVPITQISIPGTPGGSAFPKN